MTYQVLATAQEKIDEHTSWVYKGGHRRPDRGGRLILIPVLLNEKIQY